MLGPKVYNFSIMVQGFKPILAKIFTGWPPRGVLTLYVAGYSSLTPFLCLNTENICKKGVNSTLQNPLFGDWKQ